jgi:hypothetical protein
MESQHFRLQSDEIHPFKLLYGEEPVTPEEIKLRSARTKAEAIYSPTKAESKDLLEPERMKAVKNVQSYQNETRAWRDKKVKQKHIRARDLILLRSPRMEVSYPVPRKQKRSLHMCAQKVQITRTTTI